MATKLYDLAVAVSKYTTQNGQEKSRWENIGAVMQNMNNNGEKRNYIMIKRSFNPAGIPCKEGSDSIMVSLFPPKNNSRSNPTEPQTQQRQDFNFDTDGDFEDTSYNQSPDTNSSSNIEECPF